MTNLGLPAFGPNSDLRYDTFYFTFGLSSKLCAYNQERPLEPEQEGFPLGKKYVVIHAQSEDAAREIMQKHFGLNAWAGCYQASRWISSSMRLSHTMLVELFQEKPFQDAIEQAVEDNLDEQYCSSDEPHISHVWEGSICPGQ